MNNREIRPASDLNPNQNLNVASQSGNLSQSLRSRRLIVKKTERDEINDLRRRVAALEAENRSLYEQAFLLQQRLETTNQTEKERANFISTVAHELRTPLTSIKGYIDLILEGETGEINAAQRDFLSIVGANSNKLASIIGDLLDVSRLETGYSLFKPNLTELVSLSQALTESVRPQFDAKNIQFKPDIPLGGHLEMMADRDRLLQALRALLGQAGLYTPQGGSVGFSLSRGFEPNQAEIVISDDGPEISAADLPNVFTKFFRPSILAMPDVADHDDERKNTGLNLAIAKAIIERHQGQVRVESEQGLGNRFVVTLPLLNVSDDEAAIESSQTAPSSVLVVSQDKGFVETLQRLLTSEGFQVVVAQEREEVVSDTPAWQPDLIIENGLEFEQDGKVQSVTQLLDVEKRTPILSLSLSDLEQRAFHAGALAVLPWPIEEASLKTELAQVLDSEQEGAALNNYLATQPILLVSPQTDVLRAFDRLLHDIGCKRVYRATMESDALALAQRYRPMLLLVAVEPAPDSIGLFEELCSDPLLQATPALIFVGAENIAATASPQYQVGQDWQKSSAALESNKGITLNTLPKPLTRRRLMNVVRALAKPI